MNLSELPIARFLVVLRSAAVGIVATGADLLALAVLVDGVGLSPRLANLPALAIGIAVQFAGNKWFAFADRSPDWARQGAQFLAVEALGMTANLVLFDLAVTRTPLPYLAARMLATSIVYFAICLPLWSRIFRARTEQGRAVEEEPLS
jgi:putative flippase GtrA